MGRLLGVDYGLKRIGLALSDPLAMFATGLTTIPHQADKRLLQTFVELLKTYDVETVVFGLPRRTDGGLGPIAEAIQTFGNRLAAETGVAVFFEDERYTSVIATQSLRAQGIQPSKKKGLVDQTAAALILQQYLDRTAAAASRE